MIYSYLSALGPKQKGIVEAIKLEQGKTHRLYELGLRPGSEVLCAYIAPGGSPLAFIIQNTLIAIRACDCDHIVVSLNA